MKKPPKPLHRNIVLDWRAYWQRFQEMHGGNPVPFMGRLLFADGWTYSATSHRGPEWPPPEDPIRLRKLQHVYWMSRRKLVRWQAEMLRAELDGLINLQEIKNAPLQRNVCYRGEDGKLVRERSDLDLTDMKVRLEWLIRDIDNCEEQLKGLTDGSTAEKRTRQRVNLGST